MSLLLEIVEGQGAGRQIDIDGAVDVGREPGLPVVLEDTQVSRRHARFSAAEGGIVVEDLGSSNGTFVNDQPISAPRLLSPGDDVRVGVTVLKLRDSEDVKRQPSAVMPVPQLTQVGNDVLNPVADAELTQVPDLPPAQLPPLPGQQQPDRQPIAPGGEAPPVAATGQPAAYIPDFIKVPESVREDPQARADYGALARMVDAQVKQQTNIAVIAAVAGGGLAVALYFGLT